MCRTHSNLYTEKQLRGLMQSWQCGEPVPPKGQKVIVCWGGTSDLDVDLVEVELFPKRGTYGDRLYKATFSSRAGRAFASTVQEAHVVAFVQFTTEQQRQARLARNAAFASA